MNKIFIKDNFIETKELDEKITFEFIENDSEFGINKIIVNVLASTYLEVEHEIKNKSKLDIDVRIKEYASLSLFEKKTGNSFKIHYNYTLNNNSELHINKFYNAINIKEQTIINLNGENSIANYSFKTISTTIEKYDLIVHHNSRNSVSNIYNAAVNIKDGEVLFNVSAFIPKGVKGCTAEQNGRIINMNNNKCIINPNLYVEEADVIAEHAAAIGKFSDEEIFYMMSRGISYEMALNLLIKGFLLPSMEIREEKQEEIKAIIDQYWR